MKKSIQYLPLSLLLAVSMSHAMDFSGFQFEDYSSQLVNDAKALLENATTEEERQSAIDEIKKAMAQERINARRFEERQASTAELERSRMTVKSGEAVYQENIQVTREIPDAAQTTFTIGGVVVYGRGYATPEGKIYLRLWNSAGGNTGVKEGSIVKLANASTGEVVLRATAYGIEMKAGSTVKRENWKERIRYGK